MSMKKMLAVVAAAACVAFAAPAFAANPFSDVPMHHWAYDAVEQLAAHGVVEGYPDGTFKGNKPITRYEMAMMIARAMNKGGLTGEDADTLKKLMVEFKDELDNLGVRVDGLEGRVADLEKNSNGWKFWGQLRLDYKDLKDHDARDGVAMTRYRLWLQKKVDDHITFTGRWGGEKAVFERFYFDVTDFFGMDFRAGQFDFDWEDDDGLYTDNDATAGDFLIQGYQLSRNFGALEATLLAGRTHDWDSGFLGINFYDDPSDYVYGARLKYSGEKFWVSANALRFDPEDQFDDGMGQNGYKVSYYWLGAGFKFADGFELKGAYYFQDQDFNSTTFLPAGYDDSPNAWKVILDIDENVLKFTSLWLEYAQYDPSFLTTQDGPYDNYAFSITPRLRALAGDKVASSSAIGVDSTDIKVFYAKAEQPWTEKFSTFERFVLAKDADWNASKAKTIDVTNWSVGIAYKYAPSLKFELVYDDVNYESGSKLDDDHLIRFRTQLSF